MDVVGILCLILGLCQGSTGAAVVDGHSGRKSAPSVTGLPPMAVNVSPVVLILTPPLVKFGPSVYLFLSQQSLKVYSNIFERGYFLNNQCRILTQD